MMKEQIKETFVRRHFRVILWCNWMVNWFFYWRYCFKQGNNTTYVGVGYNIINGILTTLFDKINISLKYENLVDAKTRFNEVIAEQKSIIGDVKYEDEYKNGKHTSRIYRYPPNSN